MSNNDIFSLIPTGVYQFTSAHPHAVKEPNGYPIPIQKYSQVNGTDHQIIEFDQDAIYNMFDHPEVRDRKIVVFSIIGAYRRGKSFFLGYCLRFLYARVSTNINNR